MLLRFGVIIKKVVGFEMPDSGSGNSLSTIPDVLDPIPDGSVSVWELLACRNAGRREIAFHSPVDGVGVTIVFAATASLPCSVKLSVAFVIPLSFSNSWFIACLAERSAAGLLRSVLVVTREPSSFSASKVISPREFFREATSPSSVEMASTCLCRNACWDKRPRSRRRCLGLDFNASPQKSSR